MTRRLVETQCIEEIRVVKGQITSLSSPKTHVDRNEASK